LSGGSFAEAVVCYDNCLHEHPAHVADLNGPFYCIHGDVRDDWSQFKALSDRQVESSSITRSLRCAQTHHARRNST